MKTVEKNGGLDSYLINTSNRNLADKAIKIKKQILKNNKKYTFYTFSSNKSASCSVIAPARCSASVSVTAFL